ncbi:hypothetical protein M0R04_12560 [Candidatus Dojkabacteria bacterium]|jgi:hypothetical protein|nr:hypothetical protein [Candidatus Dojkabacteria bacterium]
MKYLSISLGIALGIIISLLIIIGGESKCLQRLQEVERNPYYDCPDGECFLNKVEPMTLERWLQNE